MTYFLLFIFFLVIIYQAYCIWVYAELEKEHEKETEFLIELFTEDQLDLKKEHNATPTPTPTIVAINKKRLTVRTSD